MVTWMHGNSVERRHFEFAKKARCAWHMVKPLTKVHLVNQFYVIKAKKLNYSIWTKCPVNFVSGLKFFRCRVNEASTHPCPPPPPPKKKTQIIFYYLVLSLFCLRRSSCHRRRFLGSVILLHVRLAVRISLVNFPCLRSDLRQNLDSPPLAFLLC